MSYSKNFPFISLLKEKLLLNAGSTKKTYHLVLEIDPKHLQYKAGDSIGVFTENCSKTVETCLKALHLKGSELFEDKKNQIFSVEDFLKTKVNLSKVPLSLCRLLEQSARKNRPFLTDLLTPSKKDQLKNWLENQRLPFLFDTFSPDLSYSQVLACLPPLLPRFYSIASSPYFKENELHLTIKLVEYEINGIPQHGIASNYLCQIAQIGDKIPIYVQPTTHFILPEDPNSSIILIGPGTGIAPFRAFLQERYIKNHQGKNWLFFGERNRRHDFYYQEFFKKLENENLLELDLAFSRDQEEKIYVQNLIYKKREQLWNWIQNGAYIYVCGDAKSMAKEVELTLLKIAQEKEGFSIEEARQFFKNLRKQKKYILDVY